MNTKPDGAPGLKMAKLYEELYYKEHHFCYFRFFRFLGL